jgi:hypothetical protein
MTDLQKLIKHCCAEQRFVYCVKQNKQVFHHQNSH